MTQRIVPFERPPTRWRWGIEAMFVAFAASAATRAYFGGMAGVVVLVVLLLANQVAAEIGRERPR